MNTGSVFSGVVSDDPSPNVAMIEPIAITIGTT